MSNKLEFRNLRIHGHLCSCTWEHTTRTATGEGGGGRGTLLVGWVDGRAYCYAGVNIHKKSKGGAGEGAACGMRGAHLKRSNPQPCTMQPATRRAPRWNLPSEEKYQYY